MSGLAEEIVLIDRNTELVQGQVLDLAHGQPFFPSVLIRTGDISDYTDARLIVITAGAAQKPGQSRLELLKVNSAIVGGIAGDIVRQNSKAVMLVVSNPVDVLTQVAIRRSGWERSRVMGSGTVLDSARLRNLISLHCGIDVHNVHAYIVGEHGDSEFCAWSMAHIAGIHMDDHCRLCGRCTDWMGERRRLERKVRESAYHVIDYKGSTYFAVGLALVRITEAVLRAQRSVLTVSTMLAGEYGLHDVCLSVPCIVSAYGIDRVIDSTLPDEEQERLVASGALLKQTIASL
jgi:L-lactate dehydrogenase